MEAASCDMGKSDGSEAACSGKVMALEGYNEEKYELISRRIAPRPCSRNMTICQTHENRLLTKFELTNKWCCNPFRVHKARNDYRLLVIDLGLAQAADSLEDVKLIPGHKLCFHCNRKVHESLATTPINEVQSQTQDSQETPSTEGSSQASSGVYLCTQTAKDTMESICELLHVSPLKVDKRHDYEKREYAKRKLSEVHDSAELRLKKMLRLDEELDISVGANLQTDHEKFRNILQELKGKFEESERDIKLQILTIVVGHVKFTEIMSLFGAPRSMVEKAIELKANYGILALPGRKIGRPLAKDLEQLVIDFYTDSTLDHIRMLPGKKDFVSISKGEHVQKRLILCNLRELFNKFKQEYPNEKIGFSIFCSLRPKYSVIAGSAGTHTVCVCTIHQNVKLLLYAVDPKLCYQDIISKVVCDSENLPCMIRSCFKCNSLDHIKNVLIESISANTDLNCEDVISYKEWTQTDRAELVSKSCTYDQYLDLLVQKFETLIPHQYIALKQGEYLRVRKSNLPSNKAIVLLDFSENYHFVIQNEIQSNYWSKSSCTVHPVVIYFKNGDIVENVSICILSDDLKHDIAAVKIFQKHVINYIKENLPHIEGLEYFSDGCAGQYKNCTNFLNLCEHKKTYGLEAEWVFFATSHGKSPCDGIGGLLKREAAKESLRRPFDNQILTVNDLHEFCQRSLPNLKSILVSKDELTQERAKTEINAQTIPGTRGYHHFVPVTEQVVACKITSFHREHSIRFDLLNKSLFDWAADMFVTFVSNDNWSVGYIVEISENELTSEISLLKMVKKNIYEWPERDTRLSIPFTDILTQIVVIEKAGKFAVKLGHTISKFKKYQRN